MLFIYVSPLKWEHRENVPVYEYNTMYSSIPHMKDIRVVCTSSPLQTMKVLIYVFWCTYENFSVVYTVDSYNLQ